MVSVYKGQKVKRFILLPAYNEEKNLPQLLDRIRKVFSRLDFEVVIVDDGSRDRTAEIAQNFKDKFPLVLLSHGANRGLGQALKTGFGYINRMADDNDVLVTMDADNSHDPSLALRLVEKLDKGYDISIASRYFPGGGQVGVKLARRIMSRGINWLFKMFYPIKGAKDYTSGFRAYRVSIVRQGFEIFGDRFIQEEGFASVAEILVKLAKRGARVSESPLILRYDLKRGKSKIRLAQVILEYIRLVASLIHQIGKSP